MSAYSVLQSRINARVIDLPSAVQSEVPTLINDAIIWLESIHNWNCMKAEITYNTQPAPTVAPGSLSQHVIGEIPTGGVAGQWQWKEPRENPYYQLALGSTREIDWIPNGNRVYAYRQYDPLDPNSKGPPRLLLLSEPNVDDVTNPDFTMTTMNLEVYPYSDSLSDWLTAPAGEYRVHVPYWGYLPALATNTDINWFTENATRFIVDYATAEAFALNWDEQRSMFWRMKAIGQFDGADFRTLGGWARMAYNLDKSLSYAPGRVLVPRRDVYAPRDQWRT